MYEMRIFVINLYIKSRNASQHNVQNHTYGEYTVITLIIHLIHSYSIFILVYGEYKLFAGANVL